MNNIITQSKSYHQQHIENYYRFHAYIYDITRWTFLFGRRNILKKIPVLSVEIKYILEIGCGTGHNLIALSNYFPNATIIGIDISDEMLRKAKENTKIYPNIELRKELPPLENQEKFDVVMMSYVLTMMNPGWEFWLTTAKELLHEKGFLVVVDFHYSFFTSFRKHMSKHHVRMEAHLLPFLETNYKRFDVKISNAYFGIWQYFTFVGRKKIPKNHI